MTNSIDVIKPFTDILEEESIHNVQIIGGINTVALMNPETFINFKAKEVIAPDSLYLPTIRDDKSKTLRDLDALVLSSNPIDVARVERLMDVTVGAELEQSVFSIVSGDKLRKQLAHPFGMAAVLAVVSDRYGRPSGIDLPEGMVSSGGMVKSLFPFAVPLEPESMETWSLLVKNMRVPIPNPAMSVINYATRSITGVRAKDADKIDTMATSVLQKAPELRDWAVDGPGAKQLGLGLLLRSLTPNHAHVDYFGTGRPIVPLSDLADNEMFMLPNRSDEEKRLMIAETALKAKLISYFESKQAFVSWWQNHIEQKIDAIVKHK